MAGCVRWEEGRGSTSEGEGLFCYWLFKVVQFKNWINLIRLCFSARLDMLSFLALWIVQYIVCCKIWVCRDRAVVTQPTLGVMQHCWVDSPALPPPAYPWQGIYRPGRTSLCPQILFPAQHEDILVPFLIRQHLPEVWEPVWSGCGIYNIKCL